MVPSIAVVVEPPPSDVVRVIHTGLRRYNESYVEYEPPASFAVFVRDDAGAPVGGLEGVLRWGWLRVDNFWLPEALRGQGLGRAVLGAAESFARERDCGASYLDTFEFQARGFYERHGYRVFGVQEGFPPGSRRYYLRKTLAPVDAEQAGRRV